MKTHVISSGIVLFCLLVMINWTCRNFFVSEVLEDVSKKYVYQTTWFASSTLLNVHLIPHTHDDAGWQVSVDEYQMAMVDVILDNVLLQLEENPDRRFIYGETNFFAAWYRRQSSSIQSRIRKLIQTGRFEFVNGGWVQHDEACPLYYEMIDQTTRGHLWLMKYIGISPKVAWQLDPFGHSNTQAWLLSKKAGMDSLFFGRTDYRELQKRYANASLEYFWEGSKSFGAEASVFTSQLYGQGKYGGYYSFFPFEETNARDRNYVQDDPTMQGYNVQEWVDRIVNAALMQGKQTKTNHQLWMLGNDFTYQSASRWFKNYDKLIHYVNLDGRIRMFYSTPSDYVKAKMESSTFSEWETRKYVDLFPLADGPHEYWTGYFTSRPSLKRQYRYASSFLTAARQLETFYYLSKPKNIFAQQSQEIKRRPTTQVGVGFTDDLEGALAIVAHHDGITGTARQSVTNDYSFRLSLGMKSSEAALLKSIETILNIEPNGASEFCNCNSNGPKNCLRNMSSCEFTNSHDAFTVTVYNPLAQSLQNIKIEIPVSSSKYLVTDEHNQRLDEVFFARIDPITKSLPLMYLNDYNLGLIQRRIKLEQLKNKAKFNLVINIPYIPGLGFRVFRIEKQLENLSEMAPNLSDRKLSVNSRKSDLPPISEYSTSGIKLENEKYRLDFDPITKKLTAIFNKQTKHRYPFEIEWGYYRSSVGGCTKEKPEPDTCNSQASGAYLFRPNTTELFWKESIPLKTQIIPDFEVAQVFNNSISQKIRLVGNFIRIEWTVGPISIIDGWGKEFVVRYRVSDFNQKGVFLTDANGRETVRRQLFRRSNAVCTACDHSLHFEPVSSNYYPVNSFISILDEQRDLEFTVLLDVTQGGTSMKPGEIEIMTHRRLLKDDFRGVEEPLNETMCGCGDINALPGEMGAHGHLGDGGCSCSGLAIRGEHFLSLDAIESSRATKRLFANAITNPVQLGFFENKMMNGKNYNQSLFLKQDLPENIHLLTLCSNYENGTLIRF